MFIIFLNMPKFKIAQTSKILLNFLYIAKVFDREVR